MTETTKSDRDLALSVLREIAGDRSASSEARLAAVRELMERVDMREDGPDDPGPGDDPRASDIYRSLVAACHNARSSHVSMDLGSAVALAELLRGYIKVRS